MARFARAAISGSRERGLCDMHIHTEHHHCPHRRAGVFSGGSNNVFFEGIAAIRQGDGGSCNCPHGGTFQAAEGSSSVFINGLPAVTIKNETRCTNCGYEGYVTTGCNTVFIGD